MSYTYKIDKKLSFTSTKYIILFIIWYWILKPPPEDFSPSTIYAGWLISQYCPTV